MSGGSRRRRGAAAPHSPAENSSAPRDDERALRDDERAPRDDERTLRDDERALRHHERALRDDERATQRSRAKSTATRSHNVAVAVAVAVALVAFAAVARAAPPLKVALLPVRDAAGSAGARIDAAAAEALQAMPGFTLANFVNGRLLAPRKIDARIETQPTARALALGRETNAQRAIAVEATPLGDGLVLYLQALELPSGRALGSTTVSLAGGDARAPGDRDALRAALTRILDPSRYVGRVALRLDVQGAAIDIDGKPIANPTSVLELPVGTHALRATHPAYHDFLRFLDVEFDKTIAVDVNMARYPLAEGEMTERGRRGLAPLPKKRVPWWRSWWALSGAGVVLTGVTIGVVWAVRPGIHTDSSATYRPIPTP